MSNRVNIGQFERLARCEIVSPPQNPSRAPPSVLADGSTQPQPLHSNRLTKEELFPAFDRSEVHHSILECKRCPAQYESATVTADGVYPWVDHRTS